MIHILFHTGAFGSVIEYCIKNFSLEYNTTVSDPFSATGSSHNYRKDYHIQYVEDIKDFVKDDSVIGTPVYPLRGKSIESVPTLKSSIELLKTIFDNNDKIVFIVFSDIDSLYINHLMKNEKLPLEEILFNVSLKDAKNWDATINKVSDLPKESLRELLSIQFLDTVDSYLSAVELANPNWLVLSTTEILTDLSASIEKIFNYAELTKNNKDIDLFASAWVEKQQIILDKMKLVDYTVDCVINNTPITKELSVLEEVIVHSKLKLQGIDIGTRSLLKASDVF